MSRERFMGNLTRVLAGVLVMGGAGVAAADVERLAPLQTIVSIENVQSTGDEVRARVVNETDDQLENVRLLVTDDFLWRNERNPGAESPSDAHAVVVPGPIPPHGSTTVTFRRPEPLPDRRDGEFKTEVLATELTRRPAPLRSFESDERLPRVIERNGEE